MPRPSYGSETQKRSRLLFTALLSYATDELEVDERSLDSVRAGIQIQWQSDQRLVIRTKIRFLEALSKLAGTPLTADQIKESLKRFEDFLEILEDNRPNRGGSEVWHFTLKLWYSKHDRTRNEREFDLVWQARRSHKPAPAATDTWTDLCRESLEAQQYQRLTTNPLTLTDGLSFDVHELYVPLGLIERRAQSDDELEDPIIPLSEFLDRLPAPTPQRIAIVGEPGAGKTTLLQQIATWLIAQNARPIWISLADLQGETLEQYLLQTWLKQATRKISVSPEMQEAFAEQFSSDTVWLLLDAIDEMAIPSSVALSMIARQLRGWIASAHVVLTCRSNVWDNGRNPLDAFRVYQNLGFDHAIDQVGIFIDRWFQTDPELGNRLRQELSKPERKRIRDAVKNPLRLALLCRSWSLTQGTLPNTRATLYQQFVETIYAWKDCFPTTPAQRQQLNRALGQVALSAFKQPETRFRLPHSVVQQAFGEAIELMPLALQLGWLNQVGLSATSGEKVYAFYHASFQEYFAAQAIDDPQFFFQDFRIFRSHWREVILLWLGRSDVAIAQKEAFLRSLLNFEDDCGGFYTQRAFFLAASGLGGFPQSRYSQAILEKLVQVRFDPETPAPIREAARIALLQTDRMSAIATLERFVSSSANLFARWTAAYTLGKTLDLGNHSAITTLIELLAAIESTALRLNLCDHLGKIDPGNEIAIKTLQEMLSTTESEAIRRKVAYTLGKIDPGNSAAVTTLEKLITRTQNQTLKSQAVESLITLDSTNAIARANSTILPQKTERTSQKPRKLEQIDRAIATLEHRLAETQEPSNQRRIAYRLATLVPGHPQAIEVLLDLLVGQSSSYKRVAENLKEVLLDEQLVAVIDRLKHQTSDNPEQSIEWYKLLWYCSERMTYDRFYQIWHR